MTTVLTQDRLDAYAAAVAKITRALELRKQERDTARGIVEGVAALAKEFDPNQPRVPAGSDRGGEWAETGAGGNLEIGKISSTATRQEIIDYIMRHNPPEQVKDGRMTPEEWADAYISDRDKGYVLLEIDPRALTMPTSAGDSGFVNLLATTEGQFSPVVIDSNEKIQARYGGGKLDQAFGLQDTTVLDGKHRVEAAIARGDTLIRAYIPAQKVSALLKASAYLEMNRFAIAYITTKGGTVLSTDGISFWKIQTSDGRITTYDIRTLARIAKNNGYNFKFWDDGDVRTKSLDISVKAALPAVEDYDIVRRRFVNGFTRALVSYAATGGAGGRSYRTLAGRLVLEGVAGAFESGLVDGDALDYNPEDAAWLTKTQNAQLGYLPGVFDWLKEQAKAEKITESAISARVELWAQTLDATYIEGKLRAKLSTVLVWRLGEAEHCDTCLKLNGQAHRARWYLDRNLIPGKPGSATICQGYNCACRFENRKGETVTM